MSTAPPSAPSRPFYEFAAALDRVANRLDESEWRFRGKRETLALLNVLEPHLPSKLAEIKRLLFLHWNGFPQDALLTAVKKDVLDPMDREGWGSTPGWQDTIEFFAIAMLNYLIDVRKPVPRDETGEVAVALARLVPESDLVRAYEMVYPEVYAELEQWRRTKGSSNKVP